LIKCWTLFDDNENMKKILNKEMEKFLLLTKKKEMKKILIGKEKMRYYI